MHLSIKNLEVITAKENLILPKKEQLAYPERVLQFGTGVLLRGLPDQLMDDANRKGIFRGRIVVVKSTSKGSTEAFDRQDGLYTVCFKGVEDGKQVDLSIVNSSISRVLTASTQWREILTLAESPDLELVLSNTTEVGIVLSDDVIHQSESPQSFPGKLLAILHHRFNHFNGDPEKGLVIVPTELIDNNGDLLKEIVLQLAALNKLSADFVEWVKTHNDFCNSLVDRIVPGKMNHELQDKQEATVGYRDELMIMSEPFGFWAIESSSPQVIQKLSFAQANTYCTVVPSIKKYKEIKLRLLNGAHTFSCGVALLSGCVYVKDAMQDPKVSNFIKSILLNEIVPLVEKDDISLNELLVFANRVLDRFSNPFLEHKWESISAQFSSKMRMRNLPLMKRAISKNGCLSECMTVGLAAFVVCMNLKEINGVYCFSHNRHSFQFTDSYADRFVKHWIQSDTRSVVTSILSDLDIWGEDLSIHSSLVDQLVLKIDCIKQEGIQSVL